MVRRWGEGTAWGTQGWEGPCAPGLSRGWPHNSSATCAWPAPEGWKFCQWESWGHRILWKSTRNATGGGATAFPGQLWRWAVGRGVGRGEGPSGLGVGCGLLSTMAAGQRARPGCRTASVPGEKHAQTHVPSHAPCHTHSCSHALTRSGSCARLCTLTHPTHTSTPHTLAHTSAPHCPGEGPSDTLAPAQAAAAHAGGRGVGGAALRGARGASSPARRGVPSDLSVTL